MQNTEIFGDWTVEQGAGKYRRATCVCGVSRMVANHDLVAGKSKGCGCKALAAFVERSRTSNRKHGYDGTPEMRTWVDMKRRCLQPHRPDYPKYGGRGITVCDRWQNSFQNFIDDMGRRPPGCTLDRINNDGPYSPENCRWAERKLQERNKRSSAVYEFCGIRMTVAEAAEKFGFKPMTLYNRINTLGWNPSEAVTVPVKRK